ncbi:hypothetical protein U8607_07595 [Methylobacterium durans]|uniref:Anti-sigma factor NepR domain-containing protein n=1 Tax=Methylobacterium durans TaxID=2202825 RepID=A0A2U8W7Y8_9HYPH|nr:hypothetical protein [Methylobacterium durans]AWN42237.1 hypothetical protein DK389_19190 [Methylobacterium durans]MEA1831947.1 hypothetical protein [Methylobacterium durans]
MKSVALNHAANYRRPGASTASMADALLLAKIGEDLREHYREVSAGAPPLQLARLAHLLDERRAHSARA